MRRNSVLAWGGALPGSRVTIVVDLPTAASAPGVDTVTTLAKAAADRV